MTATDLAIELVGTDGSLWDLYNGTAPDGTPGIKLTDSGIAGLGAPIFAVQVQTSAVQDGQTVTDFRASARSVTLPVRIRSTEPRIRQWWWRALSPYGIGGMYATLRVTDELGVLRELSIRFENDGGVKLTGNPTTAAALNQVWPVVFTADNPWWLGEEVWTSYSTSDQYSPTFFGDGAGGPPFYIAPTYGSGNDVVTNPGDVPAWPTYDVDGAVERFWVYVDGNLIDAVMTIPAGHTLHLYTDPLEQYAELDGALVLRQFSSYNFAPIAAGSWSNVNMNVQGTGRVRLRFRPRYLRGY